MCRTVAQGGGVKANAPLLLLLLLRCRFVLLSVCFIRTSSAGSYDKWAQDP